MKREVESWGWRAGSEVKSTYCSYRETEFSSLHPHEAAHSRLELQLQGGLPPSPGLHRHLYSFTYALTQLHMHTHDLIKINLFKKEAQNFLLQKTFIQYLAVDPKRTMSEVVNELENDP